MIKENICDPNFAEKLLNTFFAGASLTDDEQKECENIWKECNNSRQEVLLKVVNFCGNINTPQTRYVKALAWSFNSTKYAKERINAINEYLSNKLYFEAYKNDITTINKGIKEGEKFHRVMFLQYLATAYNSIKDYENCEITYKKIINLRKNSELGYILLADFYRKRGNIDQAIYELVKSKKTLNFLLNKEFRESINKKLKEYENLKQGIRKHKFCLFDTYPNTWINNTYRIDLEKEHLRLREKYKKVFEQHRTLLGNIENIEFISKQEEKNFYDDGNYEVYCMEDINLYPIINNFYKELNKLDFGYKMYYEDNGKKDYVSFKKLIKYYEKKKEYNKAIDICEIAINNEIENFTPNKTMEQKLNELFKKEKNSK